MWKSFSLITDFYQGKILKTEPCQAQCPLLAWHRVAGFTSAALFCLFSRLDEGQGWCAEEGGKGQKVECEAEPAEKKPTAATLEVILHPPIQPKQESFSSTVAITLGHIKLAPLHYQHQLACVCVRGCARVCSFTLRADCAAARVNSIQILSWRPLFVWAAFNLPCAVIAFWCGPVGAAAGIRHSCCSSSKTTSFCFDLSQENVHVGQKTSQGTGVKRGNIFLDLLVSNYLPGTYLKFYIAPQQGMLNR